MGPLLEVLIVASAILLALAYLVRIWLRHRAHPGGCGSLGKGKDGTDSPSSCGGACQLARGHRR